MIDVKSVRRQIICDDWLRDRRENLAHLVSMLCGPAAVLHASGFNGVAFDPFSFQ